MNPEEPVKDEETPDNNWDKQTPHIQDGVGGAGNFNPHHYVHHGVGTGEGSKVGDDSGSSVGGGNGPR